MCIAWFDISGIDRQSLKSEDETGMLASITSGKQKNFEESYDSYFELL